MGKFINDSTIDMQSFKDCNIDIKCVDGIIITDFATMSSKKEFTKICFIAHDIVKGTIANPKTEIVSWDNNSRLYEATIHKSETTDILTIVLNGNVADIQLHNSKKPIYLFAQRAEDNVLLIWMTNKPLDDKKKNPRLIVQSFTDAVENSSIPGIVLVHESGVNTPWNNRTPTEVNIDINDFGSLELNFRETSYSNTLPTGSIRNRIIFEIQRGEDGRYYLDAGASTSDPISLRFKLKKKTKCVKISPAKSPIGNTIIFNIEECK